MRTPHRPVPGAGPQGASGPGLAMVWLIYLGFVVYGSLVPLDYQPRPWEEAWRLFQDIRLLDVGAQGRADWIANGVLYAPLAFLTALVLAGRGRRPSPLALATAMSFCVALAVTVEFLQLHFPPRTVSLNDLLAEGIGSLLGVSLAAAWGGRFQRLLAALAGDPAQLLLRLLKAYAIAYLAFSLFPYDFLLSAAELAEKARSGAWGWIFAPDAWHGGLALTVAKLLGEMLAAAPLGYLLHRLQPARRGSLAGGALGAGILLGLLIEAAQFFLVSGISQGLSVLVRALGFYAGALLARQAARLHPARLAAVLRRHLFLAGALYALVLTAVNGWYERPWLGMGHALHTLEGLRFLPFYYHYYTTEQAALLSLTAVALMYAPIGLLTWATWSPPALAMLLAALAAGLMEASKLFLEGLRPDPTNVLLAGLAAWAVAHLARRLVSATRRPAAGAAAMAAQMSAPRAGLRPARPPKGYKKHLGRPGVFLGNEPAPAADAGQTMDASAPATGLRLRRPGWGGHALIGIAFTVAAWWVATFPVQPLLLGIMLIGYGALVWRHPQAMPFVLPAALPLLDLAPWSGRFFFDEFDVLLLISVAIGYARLPAAPRRSPADPLLSLVLGLVALTYAVGLARGLTPWPAPDANALSHYYSEFNALRVAKGALWAFLLFGLFRRMDGMLPDLRRRFALGMTLGLTATVAVVLWERMAFPGLTDFGDVYRVTGPFSQMHTGGADLEAFLTLAVPFLLYLIFDQRGWLARAAAGVLLLASTYAMMVTFARIGYAAYAVATLLSLTALVLARTRNTNGLPYRPVIAVLTLAALAVAVALPIWQGPFAQERLARTGADLQIRMGHWRHVLDLRDPDGATTVFGMGLGSYPRIHAWRSQTPRAATYRLETDGEDRFLRLGAGSPLYVEQFVSVRPGQDYRLALRLRSAQPGAALSLSLCEKWLLTSGRCEFLQLDVPVTGQWVTLTDVRLPTGEVGDAPWYAPRPVKLSLFNAAAGTVVDVDRLSLRGADGRELLANGDFGRGLDHWFFSTDNDLPWHIWSLPVHLLFEQGWLGVTAFGLLFTLALTRAGRAAWRGDALAGALLAAVAGYAVLGSLDSLVDSPRMLLLGLLIAWLAAQPYRSSGRA